MNEDYAFHEAVRAREPLEKQRKEALKEAVADYFGDLIREIQQNDPAKLRALLEFYAGKVQRWSSQSDGDPGTKTRNPTAGHRLGSKRIGTCPTPRSA